MKTKEQKLADDLANVVEDHWFNPAILAHLLSNQPHFTIDRLKGNFSIHTEFCNKLIFWFKSISFKNNVG